MQPRVVPSHRQLARWVAFLSLNSPSVVSLTELWEGQFPDSATKASPSLLLSSHLNPLTLVHGEVTGLAGHFLECTSVWGTICRGFLRGGAI